MLWGIGIDDEDFDDCWLDDDRCFDDLPSDWFVLGLLVFARRCEDVDVSFATSKTSFRLLLGGGFSLLPAARSMEALTIHFTPLRLEQCLDGIFPTSRSGAMTMVFINASRSATDEVFSANTCDRLVESMTLFPGLQILFERCLSSS